MMIKNMRIQADPWTHLDDDAPIPDGPFTVSWTRWQELGREWPRDASPIGVRIPTSVAPNDIGQEAARLGLIVIEYPKFTDGRGYTLAYLLRKRFHYGAELRAGGDITRDQVDYLSRCGFDAFVLKSGKDPHDALNGFGELSMRYQSSADDALPIWRKRLAKLPSGSVAPLPLLPSLHGESQG